LYGGLWQYLSQSLQQCLPTLPGLSPFQPSTHRVCRSCS
jgi:hypothetical protein